MIREPIADLDTLRAGDAKAAFVSRSVDRPDLTVSSPLVDQLLHFVWTATADGHMDGCNGPMREYLGDSNTPADCSGWLSRVYDEERQAVTDQWQDSVSTGQPFEAEFRLLSPTDDARWFLARATPHRDPKGDIQGWVGTLTDIHDLKLREISLREAKKQSDQTGRVKDEFLSILSHELRTPLSAILGWTQLLEMDALDEKERVEAIQIIKQQAKQQSQLIEDLLEVSRIVNNKFHMRRQIVDLRQVIESTIDPMRAHATPRHVTIDFMQSDVPLLVEGDPQRVQQLTYNLLSNAVKFSSEGGHIFVQLDREQTQACVTVKDTGRGIPPEQLTQIFDRFKQLDSGASRQHGGLGLGLTIAKHIAERHGGSIRAESEGQGLGSTFTVLMPVVAVQPQDPTFAAPTKQEDGTPTLDGIEILVVDDEESARTVVAACLRKFGATVQTAPGMVEAWEMLKSSSYRVLISDMSMPVHDGFDFIRCVRKSDEPFNRVPAIALTGFASVDDQSRALEAGFNVHVTKPVDQIDLVRQVLALVRV